MDPYLEGSLWTTVHPVLATEIIRQLAPLLRPRYLALAGERFVPDIPDGLELAVTGRYPDVSVAETGHSAKQRDEAAVGLAPLLLETEVPEAVPHVFVEIRDKANRRLVTAIEILSQTNKRSLGRSEYLARRNMLLHSTAHLMEIDLLRQGQRVPMRQRLPDAPYFVFVSRAEQRPVTGVWPISLRERLPIVQVPLLAGDDDVPLDLQAALTAVYDTVGYDLAADYTQPPEVPLSSEEAEWSDEVLRAGGLRP
jgi:hypothetical protein